VTQPRKKPKPPAKSAKPAKPAKPDPEDKRTVPPPVVARYARRARSR
jgi:hypothetical protein